jgi:hypothetical protein
MTRGLVFLSATATLAVLAGAPGEARAAPCAASSAWTVLIGSLRPGLACGTFLLATDGSMQSFSYGLFQRQAPVTLPVTLSASVRRLGPESMPIELWVLGAGVLLREESYGFYVLSDDARFEQEGWRPLPGVHVHDAHRVALSQTAERVTFAIDGRPVASWAFRARRQSGKVSIGFKGASGYRSWASFRDLLVESQ